MEWADASTIKPKIAYRKAYRNLSDNTYVDHPLLIHIFLAAKQICKPPTIICTMATTHNDHILAHNDVHKQTHTRTMHSPKLQITFLSTVLVFFMLWIKEDGRHMCYHLDFYKLFYKLFLVWWCFWFSDNL
jgi:hypothetical protein